MRLQTFRYRLAELIAGDRGMDTATQHAWSRGFDAGVKAATSQTHNARLLAHIRDTPLATLAQERRLRLVRDGGE